MGMLPCSGRERRKVAQLHRQLGGDLFIGEIVEELQHRAQPAAEDQHRALALQSDGPARAGIAAKVVMGARLDVLEALGARHGADRPRPRSTIACFIRSGEPRSERSQ